MTLSRKPLIGIRIPPWATFARRVIDGVLEVSRLRGSWRLQTDENAMGELEQREIDVNWRGDGLILFRLSPKESRVFARRGVAVINISSEGEPSIEPRVIPHNEEVGCLAGKHLLDLGLKRFAFVGRRSTIHQDERLCSGTRVYTEERWAGFQRTVGPVPKCLIDIPDLRGETAWRHVRRELVRFFHTLEPPVGIFAVDDPLAVGVLHACEEAGLSVPEQIAVVGFGNDTTFCHSAVPPLTSVAYPGRELGIRAAKRLWQRMNGEEIDAVTRIPIHRIVRRESTDILAFADPAVERAVRFIRDRAPHEAVLVSRVCEIAAMSSSLLRLRFEKYLGRSPKAEIARVRHEHLKTLLTETEASLGEISNGMNFATPQELSRFFHRMEGTSPSSYRSR